MLLLFGFLGLQNPNDLPKKNETKKEDRSFRKARPIQAAEKTPTSEHVANSTFQVPASISYTEVEYALAWDESTQHLSDGRIVALDGRLTFTPTPSGGYVYDGPPELGW